MKRIPNLPGYYATAGGRIYSSHSGKFLRPIKNGPRGYLRLHLQKNGRRYDVMVHRLVLEAFVGPCPKGMECCHNNGDTSDNRLRNLRWDTRSSNAKDAFRHGTRNNCGENHPSAKLAAWQVMFIRVMLEYTDRTHTEIGKRFGVSKQTISRIHTRKAWDHV